MKFYDRSPFCPPALDSPPMSVTVLMTAIVLVTILLTATMSMFKMSHTHQSVILQSLLSLSSLYVRLHCAQARCAQPGAYRQTRSRTFGVQNF